jgi:hypothetical protein
MDADSEEQKEVEITSASEDRRHMFSNVRLVVTS